jgi:hypothetical protein
LARVEGTIVPAILDRNMAFVHALVRHLKSPSANREHTDRPCRRRVAVGSKQRLSRFPESLLMQGVADSHQAVFKKSTDSGMDPEIFARVSYLRRRNRR